MPHHENQTVSPDDRWTIALRRHEDGRVLRLQQNFGGFLFLQYALSETEQLAGIWHDHPTQPPTDEPTTPRRWLADNAERLFAEVPR